jgi:hypothetical protein
MPVAQSRQLAVALGASGSFIFQMCHVANTGTTPGRSTTKTTSWHDSPCVTYDPGTLKKINNEPTAQIAFRCLYRGGIASVSGGFMLG